MYPTQIWLDCIMRSAWQGGIALLVAWAVSRLTRIPAQFKCWIWRIAYLKLLVAAIGFMPLQLPVLQAPQIIKTRALMIQPSVSPDLPPGNISPHIQSQRWPKILLCMWIIGVCGLVVRLILHSRSASKLRWSAEPASDENIRAICHDLSQKLGLKTKPEIRLSRTISSPLMVGIIHPAVILPRSALELSARDLTAAIAHELCHIARHDLHWKLYAALVETAFFFHPLVWIARSESRLAQEMACDQAALQLSGASISQYGQMLIDAVCAITSRSMLSAGIVESRKTLYRRLIAMKSTMNWKRRSVAAFSSALLLAAIMTIPQWRLTARSANAQAVNPTTQRASGTSELNSPPKVMELGLAVDGIVVQCAQSGTFVKKGDVILQLDNRRQILALKQAQAQADFDKNELARYLATPSTPQQIDALKFQVEKSQYELALRTLDLEEMCVLAPADGEAATITRSIGSFVHKGDEIGRICIPSVKAVNDQWAASTQRSN